MHAASAETVLTPQDARRLIDWLIAHGARRTVEGRTWLMRLGHIEEWEYLAWPPVETKEEKRT